MIQRLRALLDFSQGFPSLALLLAPLADVLYNVMATVALDSALFCAALAPDCEASPKRSNVPSMSRGGGSGVTIVTGDGAGNVYCLRYVEPIETRISRRDEWHEFGSK